MSPSPPSPLTPPTPPGLSSPPRNFTLRGAAPEAAALRVLVVPHAGAGAASGLPFAEHTPPDWLVATARLPGRESRIREPVPDLPGLVADVAATLRSLPGTAPLLVVGVCSGAVLALEALRREGLTQLPLPVAGLVVVSQWAPTERPAPGHRLLRNTEDRTEVLEILREFGGIPQSLAELPEMLDLVLPAIVADWTAVEDYTSGTAPRLDCPLLTVFGDEDELCTEQRTDGWAEFADDVRTVWLPGGHMLLTEEPKALAGAVAAQLPLFVSRLRAVHA
ncbi:Thioesterase [Actinobacteria bacterium OK074]|nr:Thioesterase [Actinobacteria bacterium OK074]